MRKIVLNLAISLDGYICDENGGFDWIVGHGENDGTEPYDFPTFMKSIDTMVMGAVSYQDVILSGLSKFDKQIVVATNKVLEPEGDVKFIKGDIVDQVLEMRSEKSKDIWLFGGAGVTDPFIRADAVDQYVVAIIPTILGNGRRLFKGDYPKLDLYLDESVVSNGIAVLTYSRIS